MRFLSTFSAPKHPVRADTGSWFASLHRQIIRLCLTSVILGTAAFPAHGLEAVFNAATDVPVTAASYTASGEASFSLGFAPTPGTNLTVVKNTGLPFISGQFSNLANGATVNLTHDGKTYPFVAWYYGGQGNNDLVLLWPHTGLAAWGSNAEGQLGNGDTANGLVPVGVDQTGVLLGKTIVQVAHGESHSLALCSDGTLAAWGANTFGALGDNSNVPRRVPVAVDAASGTSALFGKTVVAIAAGFAYSLALCSDGTVAAWGSNFSGQLGDNSTTNRFAPVEVNMTSSTSALFGKTVVAIAAGSAHSLALCSDGTVAAWGDNYYGQLGNGSVTDRLVPVAVSAASGTSALFDKTVITIAVGSYHSLALCSDGTLAAWGSNFFGQLGDNSKVSRQVPVAVSVTSALSGKVVVSVAAGEYHTLALNSDGTLATWGRNNSGQLGNGSMTDRQVPVAVNAESGTSALFGKNAVAIFSGFEHCLALCSDGTMSAWGRNAFGQLGDNSTTQGLVPVAVNTTSGTNVLFGMYVSRLSIGSWGSHTLAIFGTTEPEIEVEVLEPTVTVLTNNEGMVDFGTGIAAGRMFRVRNTGGVALSNLSVSLTGADATSFTVLNQPAHAINGGATTTFLVAFDGVSPGIKNATLEIASSDSDENPFRISLVATKSSTLEATFTRATDTALSVLDINLTGAEVNLTLNFAPTPGTNLTVIKNMGLTFITGEFSNLANGATVNLSYGGKTYPFVAWYYGGDGNDLVLLWPFTGLAAWGNNGNGQLGDSSLTQRIIPVGVLQSGVLSGKTIVQVVRGASHSLALCSDGTVAAWGANSNGQLGDNSLTDRQVPVAVNVASETSFLFGKSVVAIAAGSGHSLALCSDGTLAAWGKNSDGQLGDASTTQRLVPVAVNTASALLGKTVVAVAAGSTHNLAVCSDGTVAAWGDNSIGQLGDYSMTDRYVPVAVNTVKGTSVLSGKGVIAVAAGTYHSLALCSDGTVAAWGWNASGQIGDNSSTSRQVPVAVNTANGTSALFGKVVVAVAAGSTHNLALCSDGTVAAWGDNDYGQLGNDSSYSRQAPVAVNVVSALSGKTVVAVAAGEGHSLALSSDGTVAAWGYNISGQLGDNSSTDRRNPVATNVASGRRVLYGKQVSRLSASSTANHSITLFGTADPEIEVEVLEPTVTALTDNLSTVDYSSAVPMGRTFRVRNAGGLSLANLSARLTGADGASFMIVSQPASFVAEDGTSNFVVAFTDVNPGLKSATLEIASNDSDENLFRIALVGTRAATLEASFATAVDTALSASFVNLAGVAANLTLNFAPTPGTNLTVIKNTGLAFINGEFSNLANGATVNLSYAGTTYPFVVWYYGGDGNDLVLLWPYTGLAAWGDNSYGQLGNNIEINRTMPVAVEQSGALLGKTIVQVARSTYHSLALCSDGTLVAWGSNSSGQLGDNSTTQRIVPVVVNAASGTSALFGKTVVAVAAGSTYSLALCNDGTLVAWGNNYSGQLGDNSTTQRLVPVAVNTTSALLGKTVVAIAAGSSHSLALCSDGTVAAWGSNGDGQLGDNSRSQRLVPVVVNVASDTSALFGKAVVAVTAGSSHSLALCSDGTVAAWGDNVYGQVGDNSTTERRAPIAVNVASGTSALAGKSVVAVAAGNSHSLALCSDGTVTAWGYNDYGQLGDNSRTNRAVPALVNMDSGTSALFGKTVVAISTGGLHSLALCSDGTLAAWGSNWKGQLGDNSTTDRRVPVAVNMTSETSVLFGKQVSHLSASSGGNHDLVIYRTAAPEIEVEVLEPTVTALTNHVGMVDFGSEIAAGRTFRVRNAGGAPLGTSVTLTGTDASSFTLVTQPPSIIAPDGTFDILVAFTGVSPGPKSAMLEITSNDIDESPFRVALVATKPTTLSASFSAASDTPLSAPAINLTGTEVNLALNFAPIRGTNLTVIKNTGPAFIHGQFSNLANGTTVNLTHDGKIYPFVVWYYGGEGNNDLVLLWPETKMAAWGRNASGQLGDNSTTNRLVPVDVDQSGVLVGKTIVQMARGASHSLALCSDGTVAAWGANSNGQLGDNSTTQRLVPVAVNTTSALAGKSVVAIAAGGAHSLALCSDGTLAAWGANSNGQLGDNSTTQRLVPVALNTTSALLGKTVVAFAAGSAHSLALCSDGTVAAWGANSIGQLGDASTTQRLMPVAVNTTSALLGKTVVAVAAGSTHSLALCSDGTVAAWGANSIGQLGDYSMTDRQVPVAVNRTSGTSALLGKTVVAVAAGGEHSLALCSDGTLAAWGNNGNGQLGDNSSPSLYENYSSAKPLNVMMTTSALAGKIVVAVAAGRIHSLALCNDGTVVTWGDNSNGQIGDNSTTVRRAPTVVNAKAGTSSLAGMKVGHLSPGSQGSQSFAIYWPVEPEIEVAVLEPSLTVLTNQINTVDFGSAVAAFRTFRVGNSTGGALMNISARLVGENASSFTVVSQPAYALVSDSTFQVAFSGESPGVKNAVLEITSNDRDENPFRIALTGTKTAILEANFIADTDIPLTVPAINLSGSSLSLTLNFEPTPGTNLTVIKNTGPAFITGQFSNLANGATVNLPYNGTTYPFIVWYYGGQGNNDLVLLWPYTGLAAWGQNFNGQLGDDSNTDAYAPVSVDQEGVLQGKTIVQVATGGTHSLALCTDGTVAAWSNNSVNLGNNSQTGSLVPVAVNRTSGSSALAGKTVVAIAAGDFHSLALCSDGTVAAWGDGFYGQLGSSSFISAFPSRVENRYQPPYVSSALAGKSVTAIAAGSDHSLALCSDGTLVAWGDNSSGQLGDNSATQRNIPVAVNMAVGASVLAGKTVVSIAAGDSHSIALCSDGTLAAWGRNNLGQLGINLTLPMTAVPLLVDDSAGFSALAGKRVEAIAAGGSHSLALCSDGTMAAWGDNYSGQLGNDSDPVFAVNRNSYSPLNVKMTTSALAGKTVTAISSGSGHGLALCSDGTIAAWGFNSNGRLGDNSNASYRLSPVAVYRVAPTSVLAEKKVSAVSVGCTGAHTLAIYGLPRSQCVLTGNGSTISYGDTTPSTTDLTDFGSLELTNREVTHSFTLTNGSDRPLQLTGASLVTLSGPGADAFQVTEAPANTVPVHGSTRFSLTFDPNRLGLNIADVTIYSAAENPPIMSFRIQGFGFSHILTGNGAYIPNGDTSPSITNLTDFGSVELLNKRVTHAFTFTNGSDRPLQLTGTSLVTLSGPGADAFQVTESPADTIPINGSTQFAITFDPKWPGLNIADVKIYSTEEELPVFTFRIQGLGALSAKRPQTITFAPPSTVFQGQSPLKLTVFSSSGLPVFLSVQGGGGTTAPGAAIVGNTLSFTGAGVVKVEASQSGDALYSAAPKVVKTITVKTNPTALTLLNLAQPYNGTQRTISTLGGSGQVTIEYKIGTTFDSTAPTDAGSYAVKATDSNGTKTGTLVISKAPLYVMPSNQRKFVGQDNPALSLSYTGWVNGQTDSLITTAPVLKTTATKTSLGGVYPITASGGVAPANYRFIYLQGALLVETFAGSYEALLRDSSDVLLGKLAITTSTTNTSFSGKLSCKDEKSALSFTGSLLSNAETESATGSASVSSGGIPYVITVTTRSDGSLSASVTRDGSPYASSSDGRYLLQLAKTKTVSYRGAHTAVLEPAVPTADAVPVGAGWATASISSKGVMTIAGRLGDGTSFTSALMPDDAADPSYRLFVQPYKTGKTTRTHSHLSGPITLQPHPASTPALAGRRYAESAALTWAKTGLITDTAYRTDFGPVSTVMMLDPWLAPLAAKGKVPAITLASRLGLPQNSFEVQHSDTGSTLNEYLPSRVGFSSKYLVSLITPAPSANSTKWKVKLDVSKGTFSGSFELADIPLKPRVAPFSGVLRQPASAPDTLIGDGHYLLPPLSGTEKTTGEIMFLRP